MAALTRRRALGALAVLTAVGFASAARSPALRTSLSAGYRAFRDPALLSPPRPPAPPAAVECSRFAGDGKLPPAAADLDTDLARAFDRPPAPDDLDDPDGAAAATLTLPDVHAPITRRTMRFVRFFTKTDAGRDVFLQRYRRAALYREGIAFALREAGLPEDLLWLAAIESGFDPRAVSQAGAAGLWQFMPDTAQLYGLEQSPWVDERRSLTRSTRAAVTHLRDLYERFGRWELALAAYNAGYDRVASAMDRLSRARGPSRLDDRPVELADLAIARALPDETINYVPQILAFAIVAANRSRFGLDMPELAAPLDVGEIAVPEGTRLRTIARAAGVSLDVLREYNPQLLRDRVPPTGGDYLVAIPEARVQRALAAFPAYVDQEIVAVAGGLGDGDADPGDPVAPLGDGITAEPGGDEPLPRRPVALGHNRLPELAIPGRERVLVSAQGFGIGGDILQAKLPASLAMPDVGWRRLYDDDPLGLFEAARGGRGGVLGAPAPDAALQKQLGFLAQAPVAVAALRAFSLPNGITVRVRRDKGAPTTAITVRVATAEEADRGAPSLPERRGAEEAASEDLHTVVVDNADADAGIELAAARLRLVLGDTGSAQLAEIRFRAGAARRKRLLDTPYGPAWIALGEALFPPDHPLAGTVLGAGGDGAALRDMMIAEAMRREHALARASITVVGDVDELHARRLAEAFLGSVASPADVAIGPHPRDDRLTVEDAVPAPRVLVGWIGPGEGEAGDASLRVAVELLEDPRFGLLARALSGVASSVHAELEVWPRASVAAVELAPSRDAAGALRGLEAELDRLGDEGPDPTQVAVAKFMLLTRVQKEMAAARASGLPGAIHSAGLAKLRHAERPWAGERARQALEEVTVASVRTVIRRVLGKEHRVVVTTAPKGSLP